jgi:demethylmenaquinone methyltransferase/2-methoxy-6-polyprenyl-1,4-benzoquinol methylase
MFGRIARRYDLMNALMTVGLDGSWRRRLVRSLDVPVGGTVLDAGTGTGKVGRAVLAETPTRLVLGLDFSLPMLQAGRSGLSGDVRTGRMRLCAGDAQRLPLRDARVDAVASAFVLRNVVDVDVALREQARVVRGGGTVAAMETTPGPSGLLGMLFRLYFDWIVPVVGGLVSGDAHAYRYLPTSSARFMEPEALGRAFERAGLTEVRVERLALGTVALVVAKKPMPEDSAALRRV